MRSSSGGARDARATVEAEEEGARRRIRFVRSVEGGRREGRKRDDEEGSERREGGVREAVRARGGGDRRG